MSSQLCQTLILYCRWHGSFYHTYVITISHLSTFPANTIAATPFIPSKRAAHSLLSTSHPFAKTPDALLT